MGVCGRGGLLLGLVTMAELPMFKDGFHHEMVHGNQRLEVEEVFHPVQRIQNVHRVEEWDISGRRLESMERTFGRDFAMSMKLEVAVTRENGKTRLAPLGRSRVMEETLLGKDETIDFEDFLGTEDYEGPADLRKAMEAHVDLC